MLSDGISSSSGPVLINFTLNLSPTLSLSVVNIPIYPNETYEGEIELQLNPGVEGYYSDPEGQSISYSSK
jgi:hypothetical protein